VARIGLPPGSGPRHAVIHPDGEHLFVLNELASTIAVFRREGDDVVAESLVSTLPPDARTPSFASALTLTAAGDRVYASNRGHDSIAALEWTGSRLTPLQYESTRGRTPRAFTLSADEKFLLVGNQDSGTVVTFGRDDRGMLHYEGSVGVPTPVCLVIN
jgi:6-phosphogluconolactonase